MIRTNTGKGWLTVSCLLALLACVQPPANAACVGTQTGDWEGLTANQAGAFLYAIGFVTGIGVPK